MYHMLIALSVFKIWPINTIRECTRFRGDQIIRYHFDLIFKSIQCINDLQSRSPVMNIQLGFKEHGNELNGSFTFQLYVTTKTIKMNESNVLRRQQTRRKIILYS